MVGTAYDSQSTIYAWVTLGGRIREQKARAYHLGTAAAFEQLGDLNSRALRWAEAEAAYRESLQKDPTSLEV